MWSDQVYSPAGIAPHDAVEHVRRSKERPTQSKRPECAGAVAVQISAATTGLFEYVLPIFSFSQFRLFHLEILRKFHH